MARWSPEDKTLRAKVVYYGPAYGGKTANLEALHGMTDPRRGHELLTVKTQKDSTLFFDLLPFEIDDILGCRVSIKLYTVPGQVRYDATRKVVLGRADAIVFVADSSPSRREQNVWSLQNLRINMRAKEIDPERVPILFQINKRDVPDAAPAAEVAAWLGLADHQVIPAVANRGEGVMETLRAACHAMLPRAFEQADAPPHLTEEADGLARAIDRALAPYADRVAGGWSSEGDGDRPRTPIVLTDDDLLEGAIETSVQLGEGRSTEAARARRLAREADGFRRLSESLRAPGETSGRPSAATAALDIGRGVLDATIVTLVAESPAGPLVQEGAVGSDEDPLLTFPSGRQLLRRMMSASGPCVVDDLAEYCCTEEAGDALARLRSVAAVQVEHEGKRVVLAYAARPDGSFEQDDVRFLGSVARHVAAGLDKARAQEDLLTYRERLEQTVATPRQKRRRAGPSRRAVDRIRERFLANLSSEMQAPLAAVTSAATAIRDYRSTAKERKRLAASIVGSAALMQRQLDDLSRLINVAGEEPLRLAESPSRRVAEEAIRLAGHDRVRTEFENDPGPGRFDVQGLARAVANLIDNAVKFSPPESEVRVRLAASRLDTDAGEVDAMTVSVLDRGVGVPENDCERIFAPFARGGEPCDGEAQGLGIGLYEARCLARRHGGTLEYAARDGGGSDFRLTVPLQPVAEEALMEVTRG
jgi:signal transduction histidine kinase/signal recognition particle receptor subunit beta